MFSVISFFCRIFRCYPKKQQRHISRVCSALFLFVVLCSVVVQIKLLDTTKARIQLYEGMKSECSKQEVYDLLQEIKCFPVSKDQKGKETCFFENGYGTVRTYGGKRRHEGIDIMASNNQAGYFSVQSVCDGTVENLGWLPLGGYRIGIRSASGHYYYYAHLDHYVNGMVKGKKVSSGDVIGYMGDTGYGKEGTRGKFAVHLHFGIYRKVEGEETALNPYYLLKYYAD